MKLKTPCKNILTKIWSFWKVLQSYTVITQSYHLVSPIIQKHCRKHFCLRRIPLSPRLKKTTPLPPTQSCCSLLIKVKCNVIWIVYLLGISFGKMFMITQGLYLTLGLTSKLRYAYSTTLYKGEWRGESSKSLTRIV